MEYHVYVVHDNAPPFYTCCRRCLPGDRLPGDRRWSPTVTFISRNTGDKIGRALKTDTIFIREDEIFIRCDSNLTKDDAIALAAVHEVIQS